MDVFSPSANAFLFYDDDAGEAASTPLANQDTNITVNVDAGNVPLQLRIRVQNTTAVAGAATDDFAIQRSTNSGAYATVTVVTTAVIASTSGLTNDAATTNRATNGIADGTGGFQAGEQCTDGTLDNFTHNASTFTEHVYGLTVVAADVSNGDTIDFRLSLNGGAPGMTNAVTPRITIQKAVINSGALGGTGQATASFTGSATAAASFSQSAAASMTAVGTAVLDGSVSVSSAATASFTGQLIILATADFSSDGASSIAAIGASIKSGDASMSAAALLDASGQSVQGEIPAETPAEAPANASALSGGGVGRTLYLPKKKKEQQEQLAAQNEPDPILMQQDEDDVKGFLQFLAPLLNKGHHHDITVHR